MRILSLVTLVSSVAIAGCALTSPEHCTPGTTSLVAVATLRDSAGVELASATALVQSVEGDSVPAYLVLRTSYPGLFSSLVGHVLTATLVDADGQPVFQFELERPDRYIADATTGLRDPGMIATLKGRLMSGSLSLVLVTDLPDVGVLRAQLMPDAAQTGYHAPVCWRRGLLSD